MEALSASNSAEVIAYLARSPYDNVFVHWLIASGAVSRVRTATCLLARDGDGHVAGICYYGPNVVPYADSNDIIDAFASRVRRSSPASMLVGPRAMVERFVRTARRMLPTPSAIRTSQPVYALDRTTLRGSRADADVGRATLSELVDLAAHSARMIGGELGRTPDPRGPDFVLRTTRIIEAGWWWRSRVDGKIAFQCNVGSETPATAQLQGVWTPPDMRGKGFATHALAAICDHLLDEHPTLCLYVNGFNTSAIALYERVGFVRVGEFQTLLY